jgi:hypothetical protein
MINPGFKSDWARFGFVAFLSIFGMASAHAAVITAGSTATVAEGAIAPGNASNYVFFGGSGSSFSQGSQPTNLTNFTITVPPPNEYGNNPTNVPLPSYSSVIAPGGVTAFVTGISYAAPGDGPSDLVTLSFGNAGPSAFTFYVLYGNTDRNAVQTTSIGVSSNGGIPASVLVTDTAVPTNNFLSFSVAGAMLGDTFTFSATSFGPDQAYIGAITVSAILDAPEPSSMAILGAGLVGGMFLRRRHRP